MAARKTIPKQRGKIELNESMNQTNTQLLFLRPPVITPFPQTEIPTRRRSKSFR